MAQRDKDRCVKKIDTAEEVQFVRNNDAGGTMEGGGHHAETKKAGINPAFWMRT